MALIHFLHQGKRKAEELKQRLKQKMVPAEGVHINKASGYSSSTMHVGCNQKASGSQGVNGPRLIRMKV